jgi:hypothetical protein
MPIWTTTKPSSIISAHQVAKSRMTTVILNANGLMPNSQYTFWCNGVDMTWACRNPGTKMGTGLYSDMSGSMIVYFSAEITEDYATTNVKN